MSKYLILLLTSVILLSCETERSQKGRELATMYCTACHQLPEPNELDRETWKEILPKMAAKMGVYTDGSE